MPSLRPVPSVTRPTLIVAGGYMTGDTFQLAAALRAQPKLGLLILKGTGDNVSKRQDKTQNLQEFCARTGIEIGAKEGRQVFVQEVQNAKPIYRNLSMLVHGPKRKAGAGLKGTNLKDFNAIKAKLENGGFKLGKPAQPVQMSRLKTVGFAADVLSLALKPKVGSSLNPVRQSLRLAWFGHHLAKGSEPISNEALKGFLKTALGKDPTSEGRVAVLYSRYQGKAGRAHPELDSSFKGLSQLIKGLLAPPKGVVQDETPHNPVFVVGDIANLPEKTTRKRKDHNKQLKDAGAVVLGEYWKSDPFKGKGRTAQFLLYRYFEDPLKWDFVIVGMRSGALEPMAYLGYNVVYLEEEDNPQKVRMLKLATALANYNRVGLEKLPTRTGQLIQAELAKRSKKDQGKPITDEEFENVIKAKLAETKKADLRGFEDVDIQKILVAIEAVGAATALTASPGPKK